jgi:antitoxin (DNA-binding transcriptional repressor) of toxin-antitoxin stability system
MSKPRKDASSHVDAAGELTVTQAARNFSDVIYRVRYRVERFLLTRGGQPVAELRPVAARRIVTASVLAKRLATMPHLGTDAATTFAADIEEARAKLAPVGAGPWA